MQLRHGCAMSTGLRLEPDAVRERNHALHATCIPLLGDGLGSHDDWMTDLFQWDTEVR